MDSKAISENIMRQIRAGHMIAAIKTLRAEHGLSLKAAKAVVEQLARSPHTSHPEPDRETREARNAHSSTNHTGMRTNAPEVPHSTLPNYVMPRRPVLPQIIGFIIVVVFLYFLLLG